MWPLTSVFFYTKIYGHFPIVFIVNIVFIHWNVCIEMKMIIFFISSIKFG